MGIHLDVFPSNSHIFMGSKAEHQVTQIVVHADDGGDVGVTNDAAIRALTARRAPTTGMKLD